MVPLCRRCHRKFDDGALDLGTALTRLGREVEHALTHLPAGSLERRLRRLISRSI